MKRATPRARSRARLRELWIAGAWFGTACASFSAPPAEPLAQVQVEVRANIVFVPVTVNGRGPFWFELDSGFQNCALERTLAPSLGLEVGPTQRVDAPGGSVERATVADAHLAIAGLELPEPAVSALDLAQFGAFMGRAPDGILGYDLFRAWVVEIDYEHRQLRLFDPRSFVPRSTGAVLAVDTSLRQPYVNAVIEAQDGRRAEGRFEIDTGSLDALVLNAPFAKTNALTSGAATLAAHGRSIGGETEATLARMGALELGGLRLAAPVSGVVEDAVERAGQISAETLRRFTLTFDYSRARLILEPNRSFAEPFELDMAGWFLIADGPDLRRRKVFLVLDGSPAAEAGIAEGDELVSVDGRPVADESLDALRRAFQENGAARRVTVARGESTFDAVVRLRRML